jgi:hypothetical protein
MAFDHYFGPRPDARFSMILSPLGGPGSFAFWVREGTTIEAISVTRATPSLWRAPWASGVLAAVHEFSHSYVNPAAEPYLAGLEAPIRTMYPSLTGPFATSMKGVETVGFVNESLTRAVTIRYLDSASGRLAARRQLARELRTSPV